MDASETKILILKRTSKRLQRQLRNANFEAADKKAHYEKVLGKKDKQIEAFKSKILKLVKGDGAVAPIPAELQFSHDGAMEYINALPPTRKPVHGTLISSYKSEERKMIVEWRMNDIIEGVWDLEYVREYTW